MLKRLNDLLTTIVTGLMVTTLCCLMLPVIMQILARHTSLVPVFLWTEEISRFLFVWLVVTGSVLALRTGIHFEIDLLPESIGPFGEALVRSISLIATGLFALIYVIYGVDYVKFGMRQTSEIFDLPMIYLYLGWPISGMLWLFFLAENGWDLLCTHPWKADR
jgi:TRAP-type C4-dicarboxylate transport system permease small subunit